MNQQPDKLFREKLEGVHRPAPIGAWDKIETGLQKKNNKTTWFRVAAALLLVAVAGFIIWKSAPIASTEIATETNSKKEIPTIPQEAETTNSPEEPTITITPEQTVAAVTEEKARPVRKKIKPAPLHPAKEEPIAVEEPRQEEPIQEELLAEAIESVNPVDPTSAELSEANIDVAVTNAEEQLQEDSRVLVFSVEEVDSKYLDKESLAKATSAQKKSSTFRKLLNKAYDLKYNQDPFGDLRQKKNEILALNFKSEKRSQNK